MSEATLTLDGAVTTATYMAQRARVDRVVGDPAQSVTVDWQSVETLDSSAISLILHGRRLAAARGAHVSHANLPPSLAALAALYGVTDLIAD